MRRIKKKGKAKFCSKAMCTHSKWPNEQTLKIYQSKSLTPNSASKPPRLDTSCQKNNKIEMWLSLNKSSRIYRYYDNNCLEYYLTLKHNYIFNILKPKDFYT